MVCKRVCEYVNKYLPSSFLPRRQYLEKKTKERERNRKRNLDRVNRRRERAGIGIGGGGNNKEGAKGKGTEGERNDGAKAVAKRGGGGVGGTKEEEAKGGGKGKGGGEDKKVVCKKRTLSDDDDEEEEDEEERDDDDDDDSEEEEGEEEEEEDDDAPAPAFDLTTTSHLSLKSSRPSTSTLSPSNASPPPDPSSLSAPSWEEADVTPELLERLARLQYEVFLLVQSNLRIPKPAGMGRTSGVSTAKSLTDRLRGKEGRVRGNLMGKRVDFSAR